MTREKVTQNYITHAMKFFSESEEFAHDKKRFWNNDEDIIKKIKSLRDKVYAHTDYDIEKLSIDITFEEVCELIVIVEKVIRSIYIHSFGADIFTDTPIFEQGRFDIIKTLAKEKKDRISALRNYGKK